MHLDSFRFLLSADGQHVAYPCRTNPPGAADEVFMIADGRRYGPYSHVWGVAWSADGQHIAYAASDGSPRRAWSIYVDGKPAPLKYEQLWRPRFDSTGTRIAWEAQNSKRGVLCLNGNSVYSFDEVLWGPEFSPSANLSWVVRRGQRLTRVDVAPE